MLSRLLDVTAVHGVFSYHTKCKRIGLTHLCFVDDLLIFSKGNISFIISIQNVLRFYYSIFGLQLNCAKSEMYSIGISRDMLLGMQ